MVEAMEKKVCSYSDWIIRKIPIQLPEHRRRRLGFCANYLPVRMTNCSVDYIFGEGPQ